MEPNQHPQNTKLSNLKISLMNATLKVATKILVSVTGDALIGTYGLLPLGALERGQMLGFGTGTRVYPAAVIYGYPKIGKNVFIGPFAIVDGTGALTIGDNCQIGSHTMIWTHDTTEWCLLGDDVAKGKVNLKRVSIENNVWIGPGAIVTPGVHVGHHSIIASGSIVTENVPSYSMVAGTPAKVKRKIRIEGNQVFYDLP